MPFKDIEKRREYRRKWYSQNKTSEKMHVKRRKKTIRDWLQKYKKGLKCGLCSENHPATIDFHHTKGKDFEVGYMATHGYSIKRIKLELEKCEIFCANCHRKTHYKNHNL